MSVSKQVKGLLKAAKAAVAQKNFQETEKQCQAVLSLDESNYMALVLSGKAALELGKAEEAKQFYRKAIATNAEEQLAWKGLAEFYDKQTPHSQEEIADAVRTYQRLLDIVSSDPVKKHNTLHKLAYLCKEIGQQAKAVDYYQHLLSSEDPPPSAELLCEGTLLLLERLDATQSQYDLLDKYCSMVIASEEVPDDQKCHLMDKFISCSLKWLKSSREHDISVEEKLIEYCELVLEKKGIDVATAISTLSEVFLWQLLKGMANASYSHRHLDECHMTRLSLIYEAEVGEELGVVWSCRAAHLLLAGKQVKEVVKMVEKGVACSPTLCESWVMGVYVNLVAHDYKRVKQCMLEAQKLISHLPLYLHEIVRNLLNVWLVQALLQWGSEHCYNHALEISDKLFSSRSHDGHVFALRIKSLLACGKVEDTKKLLTEQHCDLPAILDTAVKVDLLIAEKKLEAAKEILEESIQLDPFSFDLLLKLGHCLWLLPQGDKKKAYSILLNAAQLDPNNPQIFLLLGHYQRLIARDLKRAVKCYRKSFLIQPDLLEAGLSLGEVLSMTGDEESAYTVYKELTQSVDPLQASEAWLRTGLHERKQGQFEAAITSFKKAFRNAPAESNILECLGEAYFSRGKYQSALKAFVKAVELNPDSVFCQYQIAAIKQITGHLLEAVTDYTLLLERDPCYVPALKGRGETFLDQARQALQEVADQTAVELVSLALQDLAIAAHLQPGFVCLWKLIGDCCVTLYPVSEAITRLKVPSFLLAGDGPIEKEETDTIGKVELLSLGAKAYGHAIQLTHGKIPSLWHNVSLAYYHQAALLVCLGDQQLATKKMTISLQLIRKAVALKPACSHWTALGVVAAHSLVGKPGLAQHAFIQALKLEPGNASVWCNLGSLYLTHGNLELANKAFSQAQAADPGCVRAWIGQALVAETIGNVETMDLLRHACELQYHSEAARGYAYWVCHTLSTIDRKLIVSPSGIELNQTFQHKMLQARDAMEKLCRREEKDMHALNLMGLLWEQEGMMKQAEQSFCRARGVVLSSTGTPSIPSLSHVLANHARVLSAIGKHSEALDTLHMLVNLGNVSPESLTTVRLCRALTLACAGRGEEAGEEYANLLLANPRDEDKPLLLLATALITFGLGDLYDCKLKLFDVFQTPPPLIHGMIALAAYAAYCEDGTLLLATLQEILKILESSPTPFLLHPTFLSAMVSIASVFKDETSECHQASKEVLQGLVNHSDSEDQLTMRPTTSDLEYAIVAAKQDHSAAIQKLLHQYPGNVWLTALLSHVLTDSCPVLAQTYKTLTIQYTMENLNRISHNLKIQQREQEMLTQLQCWANSIH